MVEFCIAINQERGDNLDKRIWMALDQILGGFVDWLLTLKLGHLPDYESYLLSRPDVRHSGIPVRMHLVIEVFREFGMGIWILLGGGSKFRLHKTVLVVTHELSETGAPILALEIVKELKAMKINVIVVALRSGNLLSEFRKRADICVVDSTLRLGRSLMFNAILSRWRPDYALVNSFESWQTIRPLQKKGIPYSFLIHESAYYFSSRTAIKDVCNSDNPVVFSSKLIADHWKTETGLIPRIQIFRSQPVRRMKLHEPPGYKKKLLLDHKKVVWGAGHIEYRKGTDLFLELCEKLEEIAPDEYSFFWVGVGMESQSNFYIAQLRMRLQSSRISKNFVFLPHGDSYSQLLRSGNFFVSTSRLDPFPNVILEAFASGQPCFWFSDTVGSSDLLNARQLTLFTSKFARLDDLAKKIHLYTKSDFNKEHLVVRKALVNDNFGDYLVDVTAGKIQNV